MAIKLTKDKVRDDIIMLYKKKAGLQRRLRWHLQALTKIENKLRNL